MDLTYLRNVALALRKGNRLVGWKELGTGHFSHVFHNAAIAPDVVIKLSGRGSYGWGDLTETSKRVNPEYNDEMSDAYPLYAQWCMKNQHLRGIPKVYHCEQLSNTLWLTITEYIPYGFRDLDHRLARALPSYLLEDPQESYPFPQIAHLIHNTEGKVMLSRACRRGEPYAVTVRALGQFIDNNSSDMSSDLHTGNLRFRADGSLVFTDPVKGR